MTAGRKAPTFRAGHAGGTDWRACLAECLAQIGPPDGDGGVGWLYVSDHFAGDIETLLAAVRKATGVADWFGAAAVGVCASGAEYYDRPGMALLLADLPVGRYRLYRSRDGGLDGFRTREAGWLGRQLACFGIVHADPASGDVLDDIPALADGCGAFLVGGLTASRTRPVQIAGALQEGGTSALLLAGDVAVSTGLTQGCSPIGPAHQVTACQGNVVFELDGRPALDVFREEIGEILSRDLRRVGGYIFAARPVAGSDWGDYTVRNLTGIDVNEGAIAIADHFAQGEAVMFCRRDRATAQADLRRMLEELKARLPGPPRGALYHTCLARGPTMFDDGAELGLIREALGDMPLAGFFANGEISNNRLYTYTGVLSVFT